MAPSRVVVVEDETLLKDLVTDLLEAEDTLTLAGSSSNGLEGYELCKRERPDLAILDLRLPDLNGLEITHRLKKEAPEIHILIVSASFNRHLIRQLLMAKADGLVEKAAGLEELRKAITYVAAGKPYYSQYIIQRMSELVKDDQADGTLDGLTAREREVFVLVAGGATTKEAAAKLGISARTVDVHRMNVMQKLGVSNVAGLTLMAVSFGLIEVPERL